MTLTIIGVMINSSDAQVEDDVLNSNTDEAKKFFNLGYEKLKQNDFRFAVVYFSKSLEYDPVNSETLFHKGYALSKQNKHNLAIYYYDKVLEIDPLQRYALGGKGLSLILLGKSEEALPIIDLAIEVNPNPVSLTSKGFALAMQEKFQQSLSYFEDALKKDPKNAYALSKKGFVLNKLGEYEQAKVAYERALSVEPHHESFEGLGNAFFNLALIKESNKNTEEAIALYKEAEKNYDIALDINEMSANAWVKKGKIYQTKLLENTEKAIKYFDRALEIDGRFSDALISKGDAYFEIRQDVNALLYYNKAIELDTQNIDALNRKAQLLEKTEKIKQSLNIYERILDIDENDFFALVGKGNIFSKQNNCDSLDYYQRALEVNPENKSINKKLIEEDQRCIDYLGIFNNISGVVGGIMTIIAAGSAVIAYFIGKHRRK